jgi:hypothetical protein
MHPIKQVAPHQAIAAAAEDVNPGAAGYDQSHAVAVGIEETLEQSFPFGVFVQFVEYGDGGAGSKLVQLQGLSQCCRTAQQAPPVIDVVPIEISVADRPASSSLPDLAWSGDQGHLAVYSEVVG